MPTEIADEIIVYGNVLLHENVEPRKLQIFFSFPYPQHLQSRWVSHLSIGLSSIHMLLARA